jgi:hypothetical protein
MPAAELEETEPMKDIAPTLLKQSLLDRLTRQEKLGFMIGE